MVLARKELCRVSGGVIASLPSLLIALSVSMAIAPGAGASPPLANEHASVEAERSDEAADVNAPAAPSTGSKADGGSSSSEIKLSSTGTYVVPLLVKANRKPFGLAAKLDVPSDAAEPMIPMSNMVAYAFATAAMLALLTTVILAGLLSRTSDASGQPKRAFTVGSKLAASFGGLITALLVVCTVAAYSMVSMDRASSEASAMLSKQADLQALQARACATRLAARMFMTDSTDARLEQFTSAITLAMADTNGIKSRTADAELAKSLGLIADELRNYDATFAEVVSKIDERDGILTSQLTDAAVRADSLLRAIATTAMKDGDARASAVAAGIRSEVNEARLLFFKFLRTNDEAFARDSIASASRANQEMKDLGKELQNPQRRTWFAEASMAVDVYAERVAAAMNANREREKLTRGTLDAIGPKIVKLGEEADKAIQLQVSARAREATQVAGTAKMGLAIAATIAALIATLIGATMVRSLSTAIGGVLRVLRSVADGDLMQRPINSTSKDELGELARATDKMALNLRDVITEVSVSTTEVSSAATEIAASAEEMSASVSEVARQAAQASDSATNSGRIASDGGEVVARTITGMKEINDAVNQSAQSVTQLGKRGEEIGKVIAVINDIADQTNLLALNAAIEAARAGEHGRGFAVVADEVRKLAERTTKATEEVAGSIRAIQNETKLAVERMARGTEQVKVGVGLAAQAGQNLEQIVQGASGVAGMIQAISAASEEAGAGASQSASAAVELSAKAEQLMAMVGRFKIDNGMKTRMDRASARTMTH